MFESCKTITRTRPVESLIGITAVCEASSAGIGFAAAKAPGMVAALGIANSGAFMIALSSLFCCPKAFMDCMNDWFPPSPATLIETPDNDHQPLITLPPIAQSSH